MSKILYIGLDYYHYPTAICDAVKLDGHSIDFYPIEPRNIFFKVSRYVAKDSYRKALDEYHRDIITKTSTVSYDKVFFITTHFFSEENLALLRQTHISANFIAYHWDSIEQYNYLKTLKYFDKTTSFDRVDCEKYNLNYLPLFASGAYQNTKQNDFAVDVYTIGSIVRTERYSLVNDFRKFCIENGVSFNFHLKVTPITYFRLLLKGIIPKGVSFKTLEKDAFKKIVDNSRVALDVTNHAQSGLTMRMIENIYAGRKIVTTNVNIKREEFYDEEQVYIWNKSNCDGLLEFLKIDMTPKSFEQLSINNWVKEILEL